MASWKRTGSNRSSFDEMPEGVRSFLLLLGRILIASLFVRSGIDKLLDPMSFAAAMENTGMPYAYPLSLTAAGVELLGGLALILGFWTRLAASGLLIFTLLATVVAHRYWLAPDDVQAIQQVLFMKNMAVIGGLFALIAGGAGGASLSAALNNRR